MKLCIFGADGRTGVEVVRYARAKGFEVVAFVYSENPSITSEAGIEVRKGTVTNYDDVYNALQGTDAVISVLGHIKGSDPLMQTKGMMHIIRAMKELGMTRVLSLTGTGARIEGDAPSIIDRLLNLVVGLVDPDRINDGVEHVKVLRESGLDFTVVRVLKLSKSDKECKDYTLSDGGPAELQTSRKKVAYVLVDLVEDKKYSKKFPVISG